MNELVCITLYKIIHNFYLDMFMVKTTRSTTSGSFIIIEGYYWFAEWPSDLVRKCWIYFNNFGSRATSWWFTYSWRSHKRTPGMIAYLFIYFNCTFIYLLYFDIHSFIYLYIYLFILQENYLYWIYNKLYNVFIYLTIVYSD